MKTMNRVFLMGNLGAKPELTQSKKGRPYCRLSVATKRYRGPEEAETTDWHSVFVFGSEAERCASWLEKGALVFVEGTLNYWKLGEDEKTKYLNAINADQVRFISYGRGNVDNSAPSQDHNAVAHL